MIDGNERTQPGSELHFVLTRRKAQFVAHLPSAQRESQQRTVGRKSTSLFHRIQPGPDVERSCGNFGVNPIQANRSAQGSVVGHGIGARCRRQMESAIQQPVPTAAVDL